MKTPAYRFKATLHRVIDGDTYELDLELGFRASLVVTVRLRGVDTPEMDTAAGKRAKAFAERILTGSLIVETYRDRQTFARWVADLWVVDSSGSYSLGELIVSAGHGTFAA